MGFRFNRRVKICKGVTLNLGKKGASVSVGTRGAKVTVGKHGTRTTVGIPGTGLNYTDYKKRDKKDSKNVATNNITTLGLPEGVNIPRFDKKVNILFGVTIASIVLSIFNVLFLLLAFPLTIFNLIYLAINRSFRNSLYTQIAINKYQMGNIDKCKKYCNKALGLDPSNQSAMILLERCSILL